MPMETVTESDALKHSTCHWYITALFLPVKIIIKDDLQLTSAHYQPKDLKSQTYLLCVQPH